MQAQPPNPSLAPSLAASNLACRRGDRLLFRKLSFTLGEGDALHITGANGTGKTTLMRALAGFTTPFAGEVSREGELGLLDERPALDPDLPLGKALGFWNAVDGGGDPSQVYGKLGLSNLLEVPVRYLSTGQRKRAGLAALMGRSVPIWLLDEPLSGLDTAAIETVTRLIEGHVKGGGLALIASHQRLEIEGLQTLELGDYVPARAVEEEE
ncbi:cytochrome C biogenesis protein CcmA [Erythrobacter longus]|uniref:Cytochrome C biogenesis protein CcmA n=1 Tax=Erythrobacter longus TaxID=1044 RepID=A0A074MEU8_ERYLO|nr:heme ABC exporter ATP-binding protein CcmA [Erythrobacter longus]KEO90388.1 cytochrome C biogenesis protein CcmA [Erythrobacter longus]